MNTEQQEALFNNTSESIGGASLGVQKCHIRNCLKADPNYGAGIAKALNISLNDM
jgi:catalase